MNPVLQPGQMLGDYRVEEFIGEGGQGEVARGSRVTDGAAVCLKAHKSPDGGPLSPAAFAAFETERSIQIPDSRIVCSIDQIVQSNLLCTVFPWITGHTLAHLIRVNGRLGVGDGTKCLIQLYLALAAFHAAGYIHRDIKPDNVLITPAGDPYLIDLGIAAQVDDRGIASSTCFIGTPAYASPEQHMPPYEVGVTSDVYAMGILGYEVITGMHPLAGADEEETIRNICSGAPVAPIATYESQVPPPVEQAILKMLAHDPSDRPPTAAAALRELGQPVAMQSPGCSRAASGPLPTGPALCAGCGRPIGGSPFCSGCGRAFIQPPRFMQLVNGSRRGTRLRICAGAYPMGRLVLDPANGMISRHQFTIVANDLGVRMASNGAPNPTYVNDVPLHGMVDLPQAARVYAAGLTAVLEPLLRGAR